MHFNRIYIEVSNICNLKCHFCPEVERSNQVLSRENFAFILQQVKPFTEQVCLHVMGEPLAHPEFSDLVELCAQNKLQVQITTNATLLRRQNVAALLSPIVRQVNISLQSFAANLQSDDYHDKLERYLAEIFELISQVRLKRPDLYLQLRLWNQGAQESARESSVNQFILERLEEYFGIRVDFSKIDLQFKKAFPLGGRFSIQFDSRFRWPNINDEVVNDAGFCHALSSHIAIHADGRVVPCCLDKEAKIDLGNIFETQFSEILEGERLIKMKAGFARGELCEGLCQRCNFIQRFAGKANRLASQSQQAAKRQKQLNERIL